MSKKIQSIASNGRMACSGSLAAIVASLLAGSSQSKSFICMDYGDHPQIIASGEVHTNNIIHIHVNELVIQAGPMTSNEIFNLAPSVQFNRDVN